MSKKTMDPATRLRHAGNDPTRNRGAVNPPLVRASTVLFDDLAHLRRASARPFDEFYYGRFGTPTHAALAEALLALSGAQGCVFFPSGLAAIAGVILHFVRAGDELLVADCVYGPTRGLCEQQLERLGVSVRYFDPAVGAGIGSLIGDSTRLIFCESPGSLSMDLQDLPAICSAASQRDVPVVVDNTWATPLHCSVLEHGAAVDIQAGTKYLGGHADLMLGVALCRDDVLPGLRRDAQALGYCVSADEAWLALRGLRSLDLRLRQHADNARVLKSWLGEQPEVRRILDPSWPQDPQHALWQRDFSGGNGLFSVELESLSERELAALIDNLNLFGLGYSWGGYESLCLPFSLSQRQYGDWSDEATYLRFHAGLEAPADLLDDLAQGFAALRALRGGGA